MDTTAPITGSSTGAASTRGRTLLPAVTIGAVAATAATSALWAAGRAADVGFLVTPPAADSTMEIGLALVIPTTLVAFAAGSALLALAARRSRRWVRAVMAAAAVFAAVSAMGPLTAAEDTATGVLLAAMHLVTGAAFVATAARVRAVTSTFSG